MGAAERAIWNDIYPVRNNASLLCSGVRFYNNSGGVMPRSVSSPAIAGLEFLTGFTANEYMQTIL